MIGCARPGRTLFQTVRRWMGRGKGRGKQKKQRLLDYLREHPEELRPVSRKLLRQTARGNENPDT